MLKQQHYSLKKVENVKNQVLFKSKWTKNSAILCIISLLQFWAYFGVYLHILI